jgi:hypothetical protein
MKKILYSIALLLIGGFVFGGIITYAACVNNFPTSFNNYGTGSCISSLWAVSLETKIGINSSADTSSLDYKASNPNIGNAIGSLSTLTNTTGQIPVGKGGTATTTFSQGLVMASGTQAFSSLQTNSNGSIPTASGTGWVANTLTAGSNITITNNPGAITIGSAGTPVLKNHVFFTTLGTTTWSAASETIYISMTGGGGGGGDSKSATGKGGSGGGAGAWAYQHQVAGLTVGNSYNVFIGVGGTASVGSGDGLGGNASSSNFHDLVVCGGGQGGANSGGAGGVGGLKGTGCDSTGANGGIGGQGAGASGGGGSSGSGPISELNILNIWGFNPNNTATSTGRNATDGSEAAAGIGNFGNVSSTATPNGYGSSGAGGTGGNNPGEAGRQGFILIEW